MFKYSYPIILIIRKWRITMTYMDEWEYRLWLEIHKKELTDATGNENNEDTEKERWQRTRVHRRPASMSS